MKRFVLALLLALVVPMASSEDFVIRILARVGDTSISNRDILVEWLIKNPRSYVPGRRVYYTAPSERQLLQEYVVQVLVEVENRLVGTQTPSVAAVERRLLELRRAFGSRWAAFRSDFGVTENDIKIRLSRHLLAEQTIQTRLSDSLQGSKGASDAEALKKAEDALQSWLQQLRSRYKVQIFRYEEPKEPDTAA